VARSYAFFLQQEKKYFFKGRWKAMEISCTVQRGSRTVHSASRTLQTTKRTLQTHKVPLQTHKVPLHSGSAQMFSVIRTMYSATFTACSASRTLQTDKRTLQTYFYAESQFQDETWCDVGQATNLNKGEVVISLKLIPTRK
jgi:hypothetical protein